VVERAQVSRRPTEEIDRRDQSGDAVFGENASSAEETGWRSKQISSRHVTSGVHFGTAHYLVDGVPDCSKRVFRDGPALAPFKASWVALRGEDHLCTYCRKLHPYPCRCATCGVAARTARTRP